MVRGIKFTDFLFVTTGAILRRSDNRNENAIMFKCVFVLLLCLMTFITTHIGTKMLAGTPLLNNNRRLAFMAIYTFSRLHGNFTRPGKIGFHGKRGQQCG